jgi:hypothetical protein
MYRFVSDHWEVVSGVALYVSLAAVSTMPPKGTKFSVDVLYDWAYDFSHMLVNQRGQKRVLPLDPKPAE